MSATTSSSSMRERQRRSAVQQGIFLALLLVSSVILLVGIVAKVREDAEATRRLHYHDRRASVWEHYAKVHTSQLGRGRTLEEAKERQWNLTECQKMASWHKRRSRELRASRRTLPGVTFPQGWLKEDAEMRSIEESLIQKMGIPSPVL